MDSDFRCCSRNINVVLAYMVRSEGAAFHASVGTMSGCLLNILLESDFYFAAVLNMGAAGAGLATFCQTAWRALIFLYCFILNARPLMSVFSHNILACSQRLCWCVRRGYSSVYSKSAKCYRNDDFK